MSARLYPTLGGLLAAAAVVLGSCSVRQAPFDLDEATLQAYRDRLAQPASTAVTPRLIRPGASATTQPTATQPDSALKERQPAAIVKLSLQDALRRALANSLDIKVESYSPGISAADIVVAEAAFDAVFFADAGFAKSDQPTNSPTAPHSRGDSRSLEAGFRKRLSSGAEVTAKYKVDRFHSNQSVQRFATRYDNDATLELRQPLLRNFGLDVNQAEIYIARNRRDISLFTFRRQVIDTLAKVEQAYWGLHFARQSLAIQRELLAQSERTLELVRKRLQWDALPVNVSQASSAVATRRAIVIRMEGDVKDAEDQLKNLLDDPNLPLDRDIAVLPTDEPFTEWLPIDPQRELWAALENRTELQEARLNIANASIVRGFVRNQLLPRLDAFVQWNVNGLRDNFPHANAQLFSGDFQDYVVGLTFEFPIGNRAAEARVRKSQLQLEQAQAAFHNVASDVMTQVQIALRDLQTSQDEILANREAVQAADENLKALIARRERLSPEYLDLELKTQELVSNARRALQQAVTNYNNAIVRLEQAKGTLLQYNRVELAPQER